MNAPLTPGTTLHDGKYRIVKLLNQDNICYTYDAVDTITGKRAILRELFLRDLCDRDNHTAEIKPLIAQRSAEFEDMRKKVVDTNSYIIASDLPDIYDLFEENNTVYTVMENYNPAPITDTTVTVDNHVSEIEGGEDNDEEDSRRGKRRTIVIVVAVLALIAVGVCAYLVLFHNGGKSADNGTSVTAKNPAKTEAQTAEDVTPAQPIVIPDSVREAGMKVETFGNVGHFYQDMARVQANGKWGFINRDSVLVIPAIYDEVGAFSQGVAKVRYKGKWAYINKEGVEITAFKYDDANNFEHGAGRVSIDGKWGFVNPDGFEVIPVIYEDAGKFHNGRVSVRLDGKTYYFDRNGNSVE